MTQRTIIPLLTASALCLTSAAVRGERGAGIAADLAVGQALQDVDKQSAHATQLEEELAVLSNEEREIRDVLLTRVRALYRLTRSGASPVSGGFDALRSHVARVRRLEALVENDAHAWSTLQAQRAATEEERQLTRSALDQAREKLAALRAQNVTLVPPSEEEQHQTRAKPADHGFYGLRLSTGEPTPFDFEAERGKLAVPVSGELRMTDLARGPSEGPAVAFEAPAGTSVRAAAQGRVAFTDDSPRHGRMVVIEHPGGYYTAYAGLGSVEVRVGDEVSASARIGDIGPDGQPPALIFEVRKGTRAVPPRAWLGL